MDYWLPCFGRATPDGEREPLLPKHPHEPRDGATNGVLGVARSTVDKLVDVLAALKEGKLPTQDQLNHFLRVLLKSEILKEDHGRIMPGNGPMSKQGQKVLLDVRELVEALLQFAMEKNADDKFQELYFQVLQMDASPIEVSVDVGSAVSAAKAGKNVFDAAEQGTSDVIDAGPTKDQLVLDVFTLIRGLRTIFENFVTSPIFRLALLDVLSIINDVVAHAASDVVQSAAQVEQVAERVVQKALENNDVISTAATGRVRLAISVPVMDVKNKGREVVDKITASKEGMEREMGALGEEAADKTKERILNRVQEVLSRIQQDKASRLAMRAILTLAQKYTAKLAAVPGIAAGTIINAAREAKDSNGEEPNYPPQPYESSKPKEPIIHVTSDAILYDFKDILQRLGKKHSLDGLVSTLSRVIKDLNEDPGILREDVSKTFEEKLGEATEPQSPTEAPPMSPKGKGRAKRNKKRKKQKSQNGEQELLSPSPISPSSSQDTYLASGAISEQGAKNPIGAYFARLGAYLDRGLDDPGWATSKDGAHTLETLFDDGVELVNVVGEATLETEEEVAKTPSPSSPSPAEKFVIKNSSSKEIRKRFKRDLQSLMGEVDAYVSAIEDDRTTMRLVSALDNLRSDFSFSLLSQGPISGLQALSSMFSWTEWASWGIPRLLRMLPASAIPIPSIEVKTGSIGCALQALLVQGLARGGEEGNLVSASLVPDEVVLTEWTEMRVGMSEAASSIGRAATHSLAGADVQTTSRVRLHMDGVRAKVKNMGYYFRYSGSVFGYEDEGVISVNVGMGSEHDGLATDVEIEVESEGLSTSNGSNGVQIPEIIIQDEDEDDLPANHDVLEVVANSTARGSSVGEVRTALLNAKQGEGPPLFKVVDVQVAMRGLRFKIDNSRHWILNKLCLQPLAGPVVARVVKQAVEAKVREGLEVLARGLGEVIRDAKFRSETRRTRQRAENEEIDESLVDLLPDWWGAILHSGPKVFGHDPVDMQSIVQSIDATPVDVQTRIEVEATTQGVVYTSATTTEQPTGQPAMVYNPSTREPVERVCLTLEDIGGPPSVAEESELIVAIGDGPQLFPGKGGPYGESEEGVGLLDGLRDSAKRAVETTADGVKESADIAGRVEDRWHKTRREQAQSRGGWRSGAFDFE